MWVRMSEVNGVPEDGLDYDAIMAAVLETARGRWFLREHERRIQASETRTLLAAISRLEGSLAPAIGAREATDRQLEALASMLQATRAGMTAVRHPLLEGGGAMPAGNDAFDFMAMSAKSVASDVIDTAHTLQSTSVSLRAAEGVDDETAALEREAAKLLTVAYRQEILSQRVARAAGALTDMDQRLKGHLQKVKAPPADEDRALSADHLRYFKPDEEIFARPSFTPPPAVVPDAAPTPQDAHSTRIVVIRRATGDIPFVGEDASVATV
jgi:hypothetical protein